VRKINGIFALVNKIDNKVYVRSTTNIETSYDHLVKQLNNNKCKNIRLQKAWNKYGQDNFDYIVLETDCSDLSARKKYWIQEFKSNELEYGYNLESVKRPWEEERNNYLNKPRWNVYGSIGRNLKQIIDNLDYDLEYADDRNKLLKEVLKPHEDWLVKYISSPSYILKQRKNQNSFLNENEISIKGLEYIADYLVFPKFKNEEEKIKKVENDYKVHTKSRIKKDKKREISFGCLYDLNKNGSNRYLVKEIEIIDIDLEKHKELKEIQTVIDYINNILKVKEKNKKEVKKELIRLYGASKVRKYEKLLRELKREQKIIKEKLSGYINFKRVSSGSTKFTFEEDTGYFDDRGNYILVSENKIDFKSENHILQLLYFYSELKQSCWDKPDSEMYLILSELERLIEISNMDQYIYDILTMRVNGYFGYEIREHLERKYKIFIDENKIYNIFIDKIPKIIVNTYTKDREDWIYTFKVKGVYKKCSKCGETKLTKYFGKDKRNKDGFKSVCKECDNYTKILRN